MSVLPVAEGSGERLDVSDGVADVVASLENDPRLADALPSSLSEMDMELDLLIVGVNVEDGEWLIDASGALSDTDAEPTVRERVALSLIDGDAVGFDDDASWLGDHVIEPTVFDCDRDKL